MPFCPQCRSEFRPGFDRCSDCDVALVETLPPERHPEPNYELLMATADPDLLPLVRSALGAAGIPYVAEGGAATSMLPLGPAAASAHSGVAVEILVPRDRLAEAQALFEDGVEIDGELPEELREELASDPDGDD